MARVCEFVNLKWNPEWTNRTDHIEQMGDVPRRPWHAAVSNPVSGAAIGKGRAALDEAMRRELAPMNDLLIRHGYEPV
jgi:hypothetical protein